MRRTTKRIALFAGALFAGVLLVAAPRPTAYADSSPPPTGKGKDKDKDKAKAKAKVGESCKTDSDCAAHLTCGRVDGKPVCQRPEAPPISHPVT